MNSLNYTIDLHILQNDSITIPQSPLHGASSLYWGEPNYIQVSLV